MHSRLAIDFNVSGQGMGTKAERPYVYMVNVPNAIHRLDGGTDRRGI